MRIIISSSSIEHEDVEGSCCAYSFLFRHPLINDPAKYNVASTLARSDPGASLNGFRNNIIASILYTLIPFPSSCHLHCKHPLLWHRIINCWCRAWIRIIYVTSSNRAIKSGRALIALACKIIGTHALIYVRAAATRLHFAVDSPLLSWIAAAFRSNSPERTIYFVGQKLAWCLSSK